MAQDIEKRSSRSDATSPTATSISTGQTTMRTQHHDPRTPPTKRAEDEEGEHDSLSIMTPSQPLHDKLEELEERWSEKRPSARHHDTQYVFAAGGRILHQPSRPKAPPHQSLSPVKTMPISKKSVSVEIIGSPDQFRAQRGEKRQSVFDRLYRQGKSSSSRKQRQTDGRSFHSMPMPATAQSSSVEETISTLSSSESVFDRLYKNEKRNRADIPRSSRPLSSAASARDTYQSDSMSAAASLERRLAYAAPPGRRRNRVSSSGKVASLIQQHESRRNSQPGTPRSNAARSPRTPKSMDDRSVSSNADSVFDRLYRGEKRKTPVMPQRTSTRPTVKTRNTQASPASPQSRRIKSPSDTDSVFDRLYKDEKRKTPLTSPRKRSLQDSSAALTETSRTSQEEGTPRRTEQSILEDSLRDAGDSDDSLLLDDLPAPTVLSFAKYSGDERQREPSQTTVEEEKATGLGKTRSDNVGDILARLKLQLFVRRIQRCARAYIKRAPRRDNKYGTRVQFTSDWSEARRNSSATCLQRVWRGYRSRLKTLASLLDPCQVDFEFMGTKDYSDEMQSRIHAQALAMVVAFAGNAGLTRIYDDKRKITVDWNKQVVLHFAQNGVAKMETAVISIKCSMVRFLFTRGWDSRRLSTMIVKSVLLDNYGKEKEMLRDAAIRTIQSWARGMLRKRGVLRTSESILSIKTSGLQYLSQYLTPTNLQQRSAVTLQNAWRFHQSQVLTADAMLTSWRVKCTFESETTSNRILVKKVVLHAFFKAIGRVDCLWIAAPENVRICDRCVVVKWAREVGVHYFSFTGVPHLETCTVAVNCEVIRNLFVDKWDRRKLAILVVKAALKRAILRDQSILAKTSATLVQSWFRMMQLNSSCLSRVHSRKKPSPHFKTINSDGFIANMSIPQSRDNNDIQVHAAILVQSFIRRFLVMCRLQRDDKASRIIQYFVRQEFKRRSTEVQEATAIMVIQSSCRSHLRKITNERQNKSAEIIQSLWRGTTTHDAFCGLKKAALVIQTWERRRQCEQTYHERLVAVNVIQDFIRATRIQRKADCENGSAIKIQSAFRRHVAMSSFRKSSASIVALQAAHRGIMARRLILLWHTLVLQSRSALVVQKLWRGNRVRKWYSSLCNAAIAIQASYRRHNIGHSFLRLRKMTVVLQTWYRRNRLQRISKATVRLQIAWRRSRRRANEASIREMSMREDAATLIQRWYRCHEIRNDFLTLREAAVEIQAFERRRSSVVEYQRLQSRLRQVQALFRGVAARRELLLNESSAQLIQAVWRGSRIQRDHKTMRDSVVLLQSSIRRLNAMTSFHKVIVGVSLLQAAHRGQAVRNCCAKRSLAATRLQAVWRAERARRFVSNFLENHQKERMALKSVGVLQRVFRVRQRRKESASILIQKRYRSYLCRQSLRDLVRAVVTIQAAERRRQALLRYNRLVRVAICLQVRQREIVARAKQRELYEAIEAAIFIQKNLRRHFIRENYLELRQIALRIQCMERRRQSLVKYQRVKRAIVVLQARLRGHTTRNFLVIRNDAAITVQRYSRGRHVRQNFVMLTQVIIQIQAVERRRQSLSSYSRAMRGIIVLQARFRGARARKRSMFVDAAVTIQRYHRGRSLRQSFIVLNQVVIQIQAVERRRQSLSSYQRILRGFIKLQAHCRGLMTRARLLVQSEAFDNSAILLQNRWRSYLLRERFQSTKNAALRIQTAERRRRCFSNYYRTVIGIVYLQALYRGFHARQMLIERAEAEDSATLLIQSHWRRFCSQREFIAFRTMAVRIQAQYRGFLIRRLLTELTAAVIIQSFCRAFFLRRKFLVCRQAAVRIQTRHRGRHCFQRYNRTLNAIIFFQAGSRGLIVRRSSDVRSKAAVVIQAKCRAYLASERYRVFSTGVVALQRAVRSRREMYEMNQLIKGIILRQATQGGVLVRRDIDGRHCAAKRIQKAWKRFCQQVLIPIADPFPPLDNVSSTCVGLADDGCSDSSGNPIFDGSKHFPVGIKTAFVGHSLDQLESAARAIQVKYFTWKMQLTLLMVQSSVVLLQRSVRGQLLRSAARFALSHINASLYSSVIGSFKRVTTILDRGVGVIWYEWKSAVRAAREAASIVIQSACRRMLARRTRNELVAGQPTLPQFVSRNAVSAFKSISSIVPSRGQKECQEEMEDIEEETGSFGDTYERLTVESATEVAWANEYNRDISAIVIQRFARRRSLLPQTERYNLAACQLQKVYRRRLELTKFKRIKAGIVCLQSRFRGERVRSGVISTTHASVRVQQEWRMYRNRRQYLVDLKLIVRVQSWYRMSSERRSFCSKKQAAAVIQNRFRSWQLGSIVRSDLSTKNVVSVRIQQEWRACRDYRRYLATRKMALLIQAWHRMRVANHSFHRFKNAALVLQTVCRARYAREAYLRHVGAAVTLQATIRQFIAQAAFHRAICSAVCIQRAWQVRVLALSQMAVTDEGIYLNAEESALDADTLARGNVSAMADRSEYLKRVQKSIVTQVDKKSRIEVSQLLEGNAADLESTGICIRRVACRTLDVQSRSSMVAGLAENCNSPILPSECNDSKRDSLIVEAMDTITVNARESSEQMNETPRSGNASSVKAADDFFARSTLDLASEAQQLLLEARRARVKFQETRQHTPGLSNTPRTRPIGKKQESPLFGNCVDDGELPSPIKTEEEDWDWAKSWK